MIILSFLSGWRYAAQKSSKVTAEQCGSSQHNSISESIDGPNWLIDSLRLTGGLLSSKEQPPASTGLNAAHSFVDCIGAEAHSGAVLEKNYGTY